MLFQAPEDEWWLERDCIKRANGDAVGIILFIQASDDSDPGCKR